MSFKFKFIHADFMARTSKHQDRSDGIRPVTVHDELFNRLDVHCLTKRPALQ